MTRSGSVLEFHEERRHGGQDANGWSGSASHVHPGIEQSLAAVLASLASLKEATARIEDEVAGLLRHLARDAGDAVSQRPSRTGHRLSRPARGPNGLPSPLGRAPRQQQMFQARGQRRPPAEPLTAREQAVLRLLMSSLSRREIGRELDVSLNTIKTHTRAIYRKLGATTRREAIQRARELAIWGFPSRMESSS